MRQRQRGAWLFLALGGVLMGTVAAVGGDWPRFRGPNGTGTTTDKEVPVHWTEKENVLWKTPLPGAGHSSPVVWGDRLFVQSASADGKERSLLCVDTGNGKILWTRAAPGGRAKTHLKNTLASSTPATDGERVYAVFWDGQDQSLAAYDFKGELVWKRELGAFRSQHGAGGSPMAHDGLVYFNNDQDGKAELLALDARKGETVWKAERKAFRACYSTPFLHDKGAGEMELIVCSTAGVTSYHPKKGDENWNCRWLGDRMPLRTVSSPIVVNDVVFATAGDGAGDRHLLAVRLGGKGDVTKTHLAWENLHDFPYVPCLLGSGEHLYGVTDLGFAFCCEAKTGKEVWNTRLAGPVTASPVMIDGKVYAVSDKGDVYVFEAATTFKLLARNTVGEPVSATPAVADGKLFIRGEEHLFCIGKPAAR
jgi:outer membrane protein assembly factor BamB